MPQLDLSHLSGIAAMQTSVSAEYGLWTDHRIPEDRSGWYPLIRQFYEYWLSVAPPGRLPGRQHIAPEQIVPLLPHLWILDVHRDPLRYRFRLCGTEVVRSLGHEVTGAWLDEAQPRFSANAEACDRLRMIAQTGRPTWRRGPSMWQRDPKHAIVESCVVPLAADGRSVDKLFGIGLALDTSGKAL